MGQIAHQLFVGLGLLHQALFTVLPGLLLQHPQLNQLVVRVFDRCDGDMHEQRILAVAQQAGIKTHGCVALAICSLQAALQQ